MRRPQKALTGAEYRKNAKFFLVSLIVLEVGMYVYLFATDNMDEDFALMPLIAIPVVAVYIYVLLNLAKRADRGEL